MTTIHLGSESEYVIVNLPSTFSSGGWNQARVEIAVSGFRGQIEPWLELRDVEKFASELSIVYESLQGQAELHPCEEQLVLVVQAQTGGHIRVQGVAWSKATYENKLEFSLELDQSFLPQTLSQLKEVIAKAT
ncbi:MAG: hypothetical protein ACM3VZ_15305 [Acidobacteriota bacterium]